MMRTLPILTCDVSKRETRKLEVTEKEDPLVEALKQRQRGAELSAERARDEHHIRQEAERMIKAPGGWRPSRNQQLWLLALTITAVTLGGIAVAAWFGFTSTWMRSDVIGAMGIALGIATLLLAFIASVVAVAAYAVATQAPDLEPQILFPGCDINLPVLITDPSQTQIGAFAKIVPGQLLARVRIYNHSTFPGRNPSFRIQLVNLGGVKVGQAAQQWEITDGDANGSTSFQWDSNGTISAHARWATYLPNLRLDGLMTIGVGTPQIRLEVIAEGMDKLVSKTIDVHTVTANDWFAANPDKKAFLPPHVQLAVDPTHDPI